LLLLFLLFPTVMAISDSTSPGLEELLPGGGFKKDVENWALTTGAILQNAPKLETQSSEQVLLLAEGSYANLYMEIQPQAKTSYEFSTEITTKTSAQPTNAKLTIYLYRGTETQNVAYTIISWAAGSSGAKTGRIEYKTPANPDPTWKLGVQILAENGGLIAHSASVQKEAVADPIVIEDKFGKIEVNPTHPSIATLTLRRPDGTLEPKSLLADSSSLWARDTNLTWAQGAYTYVMDEAGTRYDSYESPPKNTTFANGTLTLDGVTLRSAPDSEAVAREQWVLRADGNALQWTVERTWLRPMKVRLEGTPAIFMSLRPLAGDPTPSVPNGVASTLWIQPDQLGSRFEPILRPAAFTPDYIISRQNVQWKLARDGWAIHKLFTNWDQKSDLRLGVHGGYLFRRGFLGWLTETGIMTDTAESALKQTGTVEKTTLDLSPVDKRTTGYQLAVELPDANLQNRLASFYSSLLNGGVINDQAHYDFGNETDGWYFGGSLWMQSLALSAGVPASGALSSAPFDVASAFRKHLAAVISTMKSDGCTQFGYNYSAAFLDENISAVMGMDEYYLQTGDICFVRQQMPMLQKMIQVYILRQNADGLFDLGAQGHQYYDVVPTSGVNGYHNALFYGALRAMADLQRAMGNDKSATGYDTIADKVKAAYNRVLWAEDAPGGPRYLDWITPAGEKVNYCSDIDEFPALALGIASPEQAKKLLATIDHRIEELKKSNGYTGTSSLSAYWPQPANLQYKSFTYPIYMNGGGFFAQTYWEIVGRARYGDRAGALERLKHFAQGSNLSNWTGNNWVQITGTIGFGGNDEPYLSDMVDVNAGLLRGLLGIHPSEAALQVAPALPDGWNHAAATILFKGKAQRISIDGGAVSVTPLSTPSYIPPTTLTWSIEGRGPTAWNTSIARYFDTGDGWHADETLAMDDGGGLRLRSPLTMDERGTYLSAPFDWNQPVLLSGLDIDVDLNGGSVQAVIETSDDAFATSLKKAPFSLHTGHNSIPFVSTAASKYVRLILELSCLPNQKQTPVVHNFVLSGTPVSTLRK
jgi:Glycosyl-hydrolase family 116, catalytic region